MVWPVYPSVSMVTPSLSSDGIKRKLEGRARHYYHTPDGRPSHIIHRRVRDNLAPKSTSRLSFAFAPKLDLVICARFLTDRNYFQNCVRIRTTSADTPTRVSDEEEEKDGCASAGDDVNDAPLTSHKAGRCGRFDGVTSCCSRSA